MVEGGLNLVSLDRHVVFGEEGEGLLKFLFLGGAVAACGVVVGPLPVAVAEKDPDLRIREAIAFVFRKFRELGSIRQVLIWMRQERIELPVLISSTEDERKIVWQVPVYNTIKHMLTNPIYGGSYVRGRSKTLARIENGRKRLIRQRVQEQQDWKVLLVQHHEGYISRDEYRSNQALIAQNANMREARGELTLEEAAAALNVSRMTVLRMIRSKLLPATQACLGAPWLVRKEDLELRREQLKNVPRTPDPNQLCMDL